MIDANSENTREQRVQQWMQDYGDILQRICFLYLSDASLAEDAVQETFFKAWRSIDRFEGRNGSSEKTWLTRIAINTCKDYYRSDWWRIRNKTRSLDDVPERLMSLAPEDKELFIDILRLPKKYKEVILLYYYQEMTQSEISEVLGISRSLVSHRLHKALKILEIAWREEDAR